MRISLWFGIFRNKLCRKFAEALNKDSRPDLTPIRVKDLYELEYVEAVFPKYVITDANFIRIFHFLYVWRYSLFSTSDVCVVLFCYIY